MASTWYRTKGFRIAAIIFALVLFLLLIAPYVLDIDRYRAAVVGQLERATGADIEIEKLRLHFLPSLSVVVVNLQVRNPRAFPEGNLLAVERIDVGLAARPLLNRRVEVTSVTCKDVEVHLLSNQRGQTNYDPLLKRVQGNSRVRNTGRNGPTPPLARIDSVELRDVRISSGAFRQRSRVFPAWAVSGMNVELRGFDFSEPKWLRKVEARMDLSGVEISLPSLKEPLRFTGGTLAVKENAANGKFALVLGGLRAQGTVKVANLERPVADFNLAMKELNLAEVAGLAGEGANGEPGPSTGGGRAQLLARGTVQVDRVIFPPLSAESVQGKVRLYSHRLQVEPFTLKLYSGRASGSLSVDLARESMPASMTAKAEGVNVAEAMAAASPEAKGTITGTFEADARLVAPLGARDPVTGLRGTGNFAVRDGTFPGLDVEGALARMTQFMQLDVPRGDTHFSLFGGDFRVSNQRVHSDALRLEAEKLQASLRGSFGFDQTLNYSGTGLLQVQSTAQPEEGDQNPLSGLRRALGRAVQERMNFSQLRVPFTVRGTFQEPKFTVAGAPTPIR